MALGNLLLIDAIPGLWPPRGSLRQRVLSLRRVLAAKQAAVASEQLCRLRRICLPVTGNQRNNRGSQMFRIFNHHVPKWILYLGAGESLVLLLLAYLTVSSGMDFSAFGVGDRFATHAYMGAISLVPCVMIPTMMALGLYRHSEEADPGDLLLRLGLSLLVGFMLIAALGKLVPGVWTDTNLLLVTLIAAFFGIVATRLLFYRFSDAATLKRRVLVVGTGQRAAVIEQMINNGSLPGVLIKGYVPVAAEMASAAGIPDDRRLAHRGSLEKLVADMRIDELIVALDDRRGSFLTDEILACKMTGTPVTEMLAFVERQTGTIQLDELRPGNMIFSDGCWQAAIKTVEKRIFDIAASLLLLIPALPIMLLTALAIWLEAGCRGAILYRQTRVGKMGCPFQVLKFRSMGQDAEHAGKAVWATHNDPRVTRVGRFIRKTRIDELPQLVNVLKGEMSFVGPRPERPEFMADLTREIPYYQLRHYVNPGITGWAQVRYPYGASIDDARAKLQYDLYYLKNYSFFLDCAILFQTVQVCLFRNGGR